MSKKVITKTELVKIISDETGLSQVAAGSAFDSALDTIKATLKKVEKFKLWALAHSPFPNALQEQGVTLQPVKK